MIIEEVTASRLLRRLWNLGLNTYSSAQLGLKSLGNLPQTTAEIVESRAEHLLLSSARAAELK